MYYLLIYLPGGLLSLLITHLGRGGPGWDPPPRFRFALFSRISGLFLFEGRGTGKKGGRLPFPFLRGVSGAPPIGATLANWGPPAPPGAVSKFVGKNGANLNRTVTGPPGPFCPKRARKSETQKGGGRRPTPHGGAGALFCNRKPKSKKIRDGPIGPPTRMQCVCPVRCSR